MHPTIMTPIRKKEWLVIWLFSTGIMLSVVDSFENLISTDASYSLSCNVSLSWGNPSNDPLASLFCLPFLFQLNSPPYQQPGLQWNTLQATPGVTSTAQCMYFSSSVHWQNRHSFYSALQANNPWSEPGVQEFIRKHAGQTKQLFMGCDDVISVGISCRPQPRQETQSTLELAAPATCGQPLPLPGAGPIPHRDAHHMHILICNIHFSTPSIPNISQIGF